MRSLAELYAKRTIRSFSGFWKNEFLKIGDSLIAEIGNVLMFLWVKVQKQKRGWGNDGGK